MKEVKEWSGEARYMWVWDDNMNNKKKKKVVYIMGENSSFPVITVCHYEGVEFFKHAAEIEEETRIMTKQELSWWLRDGNRREWSCEGINAYTSYSYCSCEADEPVGEEVLVRDNGGEWVKPLASLLD